MVQYNGYLIPKGGRPRIVNVVGGVPGASIPSVVKSEIVNSPSSLRNFVGVNRPGPKRIRYCACRGGGVKGKSAGSSTRIICH